MPHLSKYAPILVAAALAVPTQANAYLTYFGEDLNSSNSVPLASFPNASAAEADFLSVLQGVATEDFEGFADGTGGPLNLSFPGSGGSITATLSGGSGSINQVPVGSTNGKGRYATSGVSYWEVEAGGSGNFTVEFDQAVAAFGFYGVDIGDFAGQIELELSNGTTTTVNVPNTVASSGSTDGSVLFFGLVGNNLSETFTKVRFLTTTGEGDFFAFDDFTIGTLGQVVIPVPAALPIIGVALAGFGFAGWRKQRNVA